MQRWSMVMMALILGGCASLKDMFSPRPEIVAEAAGQQLKVERLAKLMTTIKGVPLTRESASFMAGMWVDYTLLSQALASGQHLTDSATVATAVWPELAEAVGAVWHDTLVSTRAPMIPAMADSIYQADSVRVLQHILVKVTQASTPGARADARRRIDRILAQLRSGASFATLADKVTEDFGTKGAGGMLPPAPRGKYVTSFDSAGWSLAPGAMTGVVESPFGLHIIRRPPAAEVRDKLLEFAQKLAGQRLDSIYLDSLGTLKHLKIAGNAPSKMRGALADLDGKRSSTDVIGSYDGGSLTLHDFVRWVTALGPSFAADLDSRPDSMLTQFAELLGRNKLLLEQADSAHVTVSADEWADIRGRFVGQLDTLTQVLGLSDPSVASASSSPEERSKAVALKMETFWDEIATGKSHPRPIPGQLSTVLRAGGRYRIDNAAIDRTVAVATSLKATEDSLAKANGTRSRSLLPGAPPTVPAPRNQ
jgi:PPIC-type PPIASE domain